MDFPEIIKFGKILIIGSIPAQAASSERPGPSPESAGCHQSMFDSIAPRHQSAAVDQAEIFTAVLFVLAHRSNATKFHHESHNKQKMQIFIN